MTGWSPLAAALLGAAILVAGCGDIAYKTGAGADQLRQDREACKAAGGDPQCMKDKGWAITNLEGDPAPPSTHPTPQTSFSSASPPGAAPSPEPQADPLRTVTISGWAKFGGGSPDEAIADCVATLGSAHRPDIANHRITSALLKCMRAKHWQAL